MSVINPIVVRRSVRNYTEEKVSDEQIEDIVKAAQFAPTAVNNRSVEFIIIKDSETKTSLYEVIEPRQDFLLKTPVWIIPVCDSMKSKLPVQDISVASENMLLQIASMGLGGVWKNIPQETAAKLKNLLRIPEEFILINIIPVGYPSEIIPPHDDNDFSAEKIHYGKWQ